MDADRWSAVSELFELCLELPEGERRRYLEGRCDGDTGLVREVLELLGEDERGHLAPPGRTELQRATTGGAGEDLSGSRLGPYRLERVLGRGGMGAVYLARRVGSDFEQEVAIKLIRRGMDTDDILARFQNERRVLATLTHVGIARLLDGGTSEDGRPYLVMEVVEGVSIDRHCHAHGLGLEQRLRLFLAVCEAIQHAHERRVVHRDLKPSNILVTPEGYPKLLDFGIAKLLDATGSMRTVDVTATELRLMTPEYASPEQLQSGKVDARSDVYALGVILYELLCGAKPYQVTTGLRSDLERAICEEDPARPSQRADSRRLRVQLSGDLDTIVLTALRKEPGRRYASVAELAGDLERHLAGLRVLARPDTWRYRSTKFVRRNKLVVGAAAALFLVLAAGLIGTYSMFLESERSREEGLAREYVARIAAAASALRDHDGAEAQRHLAAALADQHGWEWRYLDAQADGSERTLLGHGAGLRALAWSADGRRLATGAHDGKVILWDTASGAELQRWEDLGGYVVDLELAPDGERLLVALERRGVLVLDLGATEPPFERALEARLATFDPAGRRIAVATSRGIEVFSVETGRAEAALALETRPQHELAFTPDGRQLRFALLDGSLAEWDLESTTHRELVPPDVVLEPLESLGAACASTDGEQLVTGDSRGRLRLWSAATGALERELASGSQVTAVALDPTGATLASAHSDRTLRLWAAASGEPTGVLVGHGDVVPVLRFAPDGARLASGAHDWSARLWRTDGADRALPAERGWQMALALAPGGERAAVGAWNEVAGAEAGLAVWSLATGEPLWRVLHPIPRATGNQANAQSLAWSPDGSRIASSARDARLRLWDARTGTTLGDWALEGEDDHVALVFSPDSRRVYTGRSGLQVRDLEGRELAPFPPPGHRVLGLALAPSGELLATCGARVVSLWEVEARALRWTRATPDSAVRLAFHPGGQELAVASADGTILLLDAADGHTLRVLERHLRDVLDLAYSPDGTRLVSASFDTTLKLWDPARGRELLTLQGHADAVAQVAFTQDGERIVSQSRDGEVRVWEAPAARAGE